MQTLDHPWQRIALHLRCLWLRPNHLSFHLKGIAREVFHY